MHSLLARDLADAVVRDRARRAFRKRVVPAPAATELGSEVIDARSVRAVVRPSTKPRSREAEAVCV